MKSYPGNRSCTLVPLSLTPVNIARRLGSQVRVIRMCS